MLSVAYLVFKNTIHIEGWKLATEANKMLEKYVSRHDYSHHTVTCMSRAKTLEKEFLQWCSFYTQKRKIKVVRGDG